MLHQIGQDMTMTEQQLKVHSMQTKTTVQLKRVINKSSLKEHFWYKVKIIKNILRSYPSSNRHMIETCIKQARLLQVRRNWFNA